MTADLDLSPEAVERLAARCEQYARSITGEVNPHHSQMITAATLIALAAENARLRAENEALVHDIARLKDSETHWLNEADRLRAERDAAWQAGAEAMREAAAGEALRIDAEVFNKNYLPSFNRKRYDQYGVMRCTNRALNIQAEDAAAAIRALPLPGQPKEGASPFQASTLDAPLSVATEDEADAIRACAERLAETEGGA